MGARVRKPAVKRRQEIVLAVLRIIGERGLTSLSTATLASEVGVTTGALFRHFASFEEILRETVRHGIERMEETFPDPALPALERLMALARNRVAILRSDPGLAWLLRSEQAYLMLPEDSVTSLRELVARSQRYVLAAIREGMTEGSLRDDIPPELLIVPVLGTIHALAGMPGVHRHATRTDMAKRDAVLSALRRMISPSGGDARGGSNESAESTRKNTKRRNSK